MTSRSTRVLPLVIGLALAVWSSMALAQSAGSASFSLTRPAFTVTSGASTSTSFDSLGCLNQGPSGDASSPSFRMTAGCGVVFLPQLLPPRITKSFLPTRIQVGGVSRLTISLSNPNGLPINGVTFTDTYPAELLNAAVLNLANSCGGTVTAAPSGTQLALAGGTLPVAGCQLSVDVVARRPGNFTNLIAAGAVQSIDAPLNIDATVASLNVEPVPIPTLGPFGLTLLGLLLAGVGTAIVGRRN